MAKLVAFKAVNVNILTVGLTVAAAGLGLYIYTKKKAILAAVNPASQENLVNKAATGIFQSLGNTENSIGTAIEETVQSVKQTAQELVSGLPWYWDQTQAFKTCMTLRANPERALTPRTDPYTGLTKCDLVLSEYGPAGK